MVLLLEPAQFVAESRILRGPSSISVSWVSGRLNQVSDNYDYHMEDAFTDSAEEGQLGGSSRVLGGMENSSFIFEVGEVIATVKVSWASGDSLAF